MSKLISVIVFLTIVTISSSVVPAQAPSPSESDKERKERIRREEKEQKEKAKQLEAQRKADIKETRQKDKADAKRRKELGPDEIWSTYDRFTDRSVISFYTKVVDNLWLDWTALMLGAEFNYGGSDIQSNAKNGRYFLTVAYIFNTEYPLSSNSLILLVDGERLDLGQMTVSRYNKATSEGILARGVIVYVYREVARDVLRKIADAKVVEGRLNLFEFQVKPRYMYTLREMLSQIPQ